MLPGNQQRQHVVALPAYLQTDLDPGRLGGWKENLVVEKMFIRLRWLRVTAATAAEEGLEDVAEVAAAFVLETPLTILVMLGPLRAIAQDLVRPGDLLELLEVAAPGGAGLHGQLPAASCAPS